MQENNKKEEALKQPSMGLFSRIMGVIFSPSRTFSYLNKRPDWLAILIVIIIFSLCMSLLYAQKTDLKAMTRLQLERSGRAEQMTEAQLDRAADISGKIGRYMMIVGPIFGTPIVFLIVAGLLHLIFSLFQGDTTFKKVFSVVAYSFVPSIFSSIIGILLLLTRKVNEVPIEELVKSNLSILFVQGETSKFLWNLSQAIDLFSIWAVVLLGIGMAAISKLKQKTSYIIVISLWIVWILLTAFLRGFRG
jgi:hypothetical protein